MWPSSQSAFTAVVKFKTAPPGIYFPIVGSTDYEYINTVKFGAIDNTSGDSFGYADFTNLSTSVPAGSPKKITLTPGFHIGTSTEYWRVYIDYSHDGGFEGANEMVGQGFATGPVSFDITAPLTALNGKTRMRIIMHYNSYLEETCNKFFDGEAEDYTVKVTGGTLNVSAAESDLKANLNNLIISPNPVTGASASVVLQAAKAGAVNIKIADLSGRILRSETISSVIAGRNNYPLSNINLLPGTYMVIAQQGNAVVARTQFVVDK